MLREEYSHTATMDVRDACALALKRLLLSIDRTIEGEHIQFAQVFDEWPTSDDKFDCPAACVLPPPEWRYDDTGGTPKLMEQTIEPLPIPTPADGAIVPPAFGLFKTAEMLDEFGIILRTTTTAKRSMLKLAVEEAFQTANVTMDPNGQRYGLLLDLPEYYDLKARASLLRGQNSDSDDAAMRNQREATFVVSMQAPKVQVGAVWPLALTVTRATQTADGATISTAVVQIPTPYRS
jgi:hypothetical protein